MSIVKAKESEAKLLADIVSRANKDVAERFELTLDNNPKHPSFYTEAWAQSDFARGENYFIFQQSGKSIGCVAFESPDPATAYLNRLSVLPEYRRQGVGECLVKHIIDYSRSKKMKEVSIGIIADHTELRDRYGKQGFVEGETREFPHLPFLVTYMTYTI